MKILDHFALGTESTGHPESPVIAITDDEIEDAEEADRILRSGRGTPITDREEVLQLLDNAASECSIETMRGRTLAARSAAIIRADAATIARLRAVARAAQQLNGTLHVDENGLYKMVELIAYDHDGEPSVAGAEEHPDVEAAMEQMTAALSALAPGDLGGDDGAKEGT